MRVENGFPGAGYCPFPFETVILNGPPKARCIDVRKPRTSRSQREPLEGRKEAQQIRIIGTLAHTPNLLLERAAEQFTRERR